MNTTALPAGLRRILCIGGGPAGLYFALLMKRRHPALAITVVERNRPFDTFGWGVVFSDQTLGNLRRADPETAQLIGDAFNHWDDIEVFFKGGRVRSGGHGFCGIGRKRLLNILQERCQSLGVNLVFETDVTDDQALAAQHDADLVIASDGLNSRIRTRYAATFQPDIDTRQCRFVWLGTKKTFDAFTFAFVPTEHGWFQAHAYKFDADTSTFIVETPEHVWQAHGIDRMSQEEAIAFCERLFAPWLDGHRLISNASHLRGSAIWIRFPRVICQTWVHTETIAGKPTPIVLMGDAAHTAHFSIGSGTKLALEDAIDLADTFSQHPDHGLATVLQAYEARRSVEVLKIQNAARNSTEWFEHVDRYSGMEVEQFAYSLLTRSQRISHENLRLRDAKWLEGYEHWLMQKAGAAPARHPTPPMLLPLTVRGCALKNRIVVSPMAQYKATDGVVGDWHLMHLGARAVGGAALVMVEMTSPTPEGRITPGCPGLWNDAQQAALARIVDFAHRESGARMGLQLGRHRRAAALGRRPPRRGAELAAAVRQRGGLRRTEPGAARHDPRRHGRHDRGLRGGRPARRRRRLRLAGAARRARLPALGFPLPAHQPAHRRLRRLAGEPRPVPAGGVCGGACRLAGRPADERAHFGPRLGTGRQHAGRRGGHRPPVQGRGLRRDRCLLRPDHPPGQAGLRTHVPDTVCRPHPQRG
jgi:anthraniloyl-CoA monooxygenase